MNSLPEALFCSHEQNSPIGLIEVYASSGGISAVNLRGHNAAASINTLPDSELTSQALQQILEFLAGKRRDFDLPMDLAGTAPFQKREPGTKPQSRRTTVITLIWRSMKSQILPSIAENWGLMPRSIPNHKRSL